jgi:hypothetical protein
LTFGVSFLYLSRLILPFTISHTIAAFPIKRVIPRLPLDALMIGATGPDLEYLYNLRVHGKYWHTLEGMFVGAVPMCFVLIFLWRKAVYPALLALLPKLRDSGKVPSRMAAPILFTILATMLGASTHIVWDAFTHFNGWGVFLVPWLLLRWTPLGPSYALLQDFSSFLGVVIIGFKLRWVFERYKDELAPIDLTRLWLVIGVTGIVSIFGGVINAMRWHAEKTGIVIGQFAIGGMAAFVLFVAVLSAVILCVRWWSYRQLASAN